MRMQYIKSLLFCSQNWLCQKKVSDNRTYGLRYQFTSHGRLRMYQSRQERSELISCLPFASIKLTCRAQKEQSTINKTPLARSAQCKQKNRELLLHTTHTWSPWHMPRKPQVFCCWQLSSWPWPWSSHLAMLQVTNFCPAYSLQKKKLSCVDVRLLTAMHFWWHWQTTATRSFRAPTRRAATTARRTTTRTSRRTARRVSTTPAAAAECRMHERWPASGVWSVCRRRTAGEIWLSSAGVIDVTVAHSMNEWRWC